jgi:hypothetical protein
MQSKLCVDNLLQIQAHKEALTEPIGAWTKATIVDHKKVCIGQK